MASSKPPILTLSCDEDLTIEEWLQIEAEPGSGKTLHPKIKYGNVLWQPAEEEAIKALIEERGETSWPMSIYMTARGRTSRGSCNRAAPPISSRGFSTSRTAFPLYARHSKMRRRRAGTTNQIKEHQRRMRGSPKRRRGSESS